MIDFFSSIFHIVYNFYFLDTVKVRAVARSTIKFLTIFRVLLTKTRHATACNFMVGEVKSSQGLGENKLSYLFE